MEGESGEQVSTSQDGRQCCIVMHFLLLVYDDKERCITSTVVWPKISQKNLLAVTHRTKVG